MPIPFIIAGAAVAVSAAGVKKGFDAKEKNERAETISKEAEDKLLLAQNDFRAEQVYIEEYLSDFARFKIFVFKVQIQSLIDYIKQSKKNANSELGLEQLTFTNTELKKLEVGIANSINISSGLAKGATSGALIAFGTYGGVGALATASTGTAISGLGGAAATNATLAWLGGGSLAIGGGGMALGTAVLGGVVAAPLIAITGFFMDSKAEKNLTAAAKFEKNVEIEIAKMNSKVNDFETIEKYVDELGNNIVKTSDRFDILLNKLINSKNNESNEVNQVLILGKALKELLGISLLSKKGNRNKNFKREIERITIS